MLPFLIWRFSHKFGNISTQTVYSTWNVLAAVSRAELYSAPFARRGRWQSGSSKRTRTYDGAGGGDWPSLRLEVVWSHKFSFMLVRLASVAMKVIIFTLLCKDIFTNFVL